MRTCCLHSGGRTPRQQNHLKMSPCLLGMVPDIRQVWRSSVHRRGLVNERSPSQRCKALIKPLSVHLISLYVSTLMNPASLHIIHTVGAECCRAALVLHACNERPGCLFPPPQTFIQSSAQAVPPLGILPQFPPEAALILSSALWFCVYTSSPAVNAMPHVGWVFFPITVRFIS